MPIYRAYLIDAQDRVASYRAVDAETDAAALQAAYAFVDGCDVEVWRLDRKIGRLAGALNQEAQDLPGTDHFGKPREA